MAATRLIALHINKGKSVAQCLRDRTDYAQNPEKTEKGELVTAYDELELDTLGVNRPILCGQYKKEACKG